ncbi:transposase [Labrenzia sp. R4_1]|nr:transposase [Labrenzia sp. R4_1]
MPTERHAQLFLENAIWGDDRFCPHCGSLKSRPLRGPLFQFFTIDLSGLVSLRFFGRAYASGPTPNGLSDKCVAVYRVTNLSRGPTHDIEQGRHSAKQGETQCRAAKHENGFKICQSAIHCPAFLITRL